MELCCSSLCGRMVARRCRAGKNSKQSAKLTLWPLQSQDQWGVPEVRNSLRLEHMTAYGALNQCINLSKELPKLKSISGGRKEENVEVMYLRAEEDGCSSGISSLFNSKESGCMTRYLSPYQLLYPLPASAGVTEVTGQVKYGWDGVFPEYSPIRTLQIKVRHASRL